MTGNGSVGAFLENKGYDETFGRTIEDLFQLAPLGYAADARSFGPDVFGAG